MSERDEGEAPARNGVSRVSSAVGIARRWLLPALLVTTLLAVAAVVLTTPQLENDLESRVAARLAQAGHDWATVAVDGREVILAGTAPTEVERLNARDAAAAVWGVGTLRDDSELIPLASPFVWAAERRGDGVVVLSGFTPSELVQSTLGEMVSAVLPADAVDDRTELARGPPPDFQQGVEFALRILANLTSGRVELSGLEVAADGVASDILRYESALQIAESGAPPGFVVSRLDVLLPVADPYVWSITIGDEVAVMSGSVPSLTVSQNLAAAANESFAGILIDNRTELASGQPAAFAEMARRALGFAALLGSGEAVLTGTELVISGRARSPEAYERLLDLLAGDQPNGLTIAVQDIAPSVADAYVLEVVRSGDGVALIGFMPTEEARGEVLSDAEQLFGSGAIEDRLQIADGAPRMDWIGAAKFALGQVAALSGGSARISDHSYSLTGAAATSESYEELRGVLEGTLPSSLVVTNVLLSAPVASPYRLNASVGPEAVTLTGFAPSPEARDRFSEAAATRFPALEIVNEVRLAQGAPVGFEAAVVAGLQAISRLQAGQFELVDLALSLNGVAPHQGAVESISAQLADALPSGFAIEADVTATPAQSRVSAAICQELLVAELGSDGVKFNEGSTAVAPESEGRLDRLVAILQRCPDAAVEIGGHTDSGGAAERNRALSQLRADSVRDYLVESGIAADRLTAVGYGEDDPIADNDTEEGRARNRRIEFTIVEP